MDAKEVTKWEVQVLFRLQCNTCHNTLTVSQSCPSQEEAIQECIEYGWQLRENGPMCDSCVAE
jgi:hypothetical protein